MRDRRIPVAALPDGQLELVLRRGGGGGGEQGGADQYNKRPLSARLRKVVEVRLLVDHLAVLPPEVVVPLPVQHVTFDTHDEAVVGIANVGLASAAFEVSASDDHLSRGGRRDAHSVFERLRQQRVGVGEREYRTEENAAGRDLRDRPSVAEIEFTIDARVRECVVVREHIGEIALVIGLEVVVRTEVELVGRGDEGTYVAGRVGDGERPAGDAVEEATGVGCRRTRAELRGAVGLGGGERARAVVVLALQDRGLMPVFEIDCRVTLAVGEVAA